MSQAEQFEVLILGSGQSGKLLAWHMARAGRRTAVIERRWIGASCPNIACLPSKKKIWSARVAHLTEHAAQFGTMISGPVTTDIVSGAELIIGTGRLVAPKTLEVRLNDGGTRVLTGDQDWPRLTITPVAA